MNLSTFLRIVFICGLLICNTFVLHASGVLIPQETATPYPNPARLEDSIQAFEAESKTIPARESAIVGIGSSSMRLWDTIHRDLAPLKIIHRGFGGSTMNDVLYFADRIVLPYRPRAVLLYEGENDAEIGIPPERIVETFHAFVAKVHETLPKTRIYIIAIKPSPNRWRIRNIIKQANELFREACYVHPLLTFIDVATPMLDEHKEPKSDIFVEDQVHMNEKGYRIWTETIRPVVMENEAKFEK